MKSVGKKSENMKAEAVQACLEGILTRGGLGGHACDRHSCDFLLYARDTRPTITYHLAQRIHATYWRDED